MRVVIRSYSLLIILHSLGQQETRRFTNTFPLSIIQMNRT
ncbi:hypothetical protein BCAH1134_C0257 (plasmid) [Bacillus cereus AH1134]|nr:hypothetical protein BCAH1134_C0257 [Bacillus cereus AH1134]